MMIVLSKALRRVGTGGLTSGLLHAMEKHDITTPPRVAHFIAQLGHESGGFRRSVEGLRYSSSGLRRVWPRRFDEPTANAYAWQPERIANKVYAGRLGNGDEASGDGWRFRGRGLIQLTGRANYTKASEAVFGDDRLLGRPELAATPDNMPRIAAWWWDSHGLNALADMDDILGITRIVNGGLNGIEDRRLWLTKVRDAITWSTIPDEPTEEIVA